ncbi:MAG TPA: prepilin-type N-terminal cleavage/methylation domain-containing protein [bacterium]|nr:prepilin-type N-terminal cleavage/methylation domain-containing protein [bacterium]HPN31240.1 prepilin-type N-terminal cleavage/methylation domain-containing protein [bacterium]
MKINGFTLIELLVVAAILGMCSLYSYKLLFTANSNFRKLQNNIDSLSEKDKIFEELFNRIKSADFIANGNQTNFTLKKNEFNSEDLSEKNYIFITVESNNLIADDKIISDKIQFLEFYFDKSPPLTRHIIFKLKLLNSNTTYFTGLCLRNYALKN